MKIVLFITIVFPVFISAQIHLYEFNVPGVDVSGTAIYDQVPAYVFGTGANYTEEYGVNLKVVNTGINAIELKLRTSEVDTCSGSANSTSWVLHPIFQSVGSEPVQVSHFSNTLQPGDTIYDFGGDFRTTDTTCCARYLYEWIDVNNSDSVVAWVYVHFDATHGACMVGVDEELSNTVEVFPNPVNSSLNIKHLDENMIQEIHVYNLIGEQVMSRVVTRGVNQVQLNTKNLINGMYLVTIIQNNKVFTTQRVIVQH